MRFSSLFSFGKKKEKQENVNMASYKDVQTDDAIDTEGEDVNETYNKKSARNDTVSSRKSLLISFPVIVLGVFLLLGVIVASVVFFLPKTKSDNMDFISKKDQTQTGYIPPLSSQSNVVQPSPDSVAPLSPDAAQNNPSVASAPNVQVNQQVGVVAEKNKLQQVVAEKNKLQQNVKTENKPTTESKSTTNTESKVVVKDVKKEDISDIVNEIYALKVKEEKLKRQLAIAELERKLKNPWKLSSQSSQDAEIKNIVDSVRRDVNNVNVPMDSASLFTTKQGTQAFPTNSDIRPEFSSASMPMKPMGISPVQFETPKKLVGILNNMAIFDIGGNRVLLKKGDTYENIEILDISGGCVIYNEKKYILVSDAPGVDKSGKGSTAKKKSVVSQPQRQEIVNRLTQCI